MELWSISKNNIKIKFSIKNQIKNKAALKKFQVLNLNKWKIHILKILFKIFKNQNKKLMGNKCLIKLKKLINVQIIFIWTFLNKNQAWILEMLKLSHINLKMQI